MNSLLKTAIIAFLLGVAAYFFVIKPAKAFAADIDLPRIDGTVIIPTETTPLFMEVDIDADPATCDTMADSLNTHFRDREAQMAEILGLTDYQLKTEIVCKHRFGSAPPTVVDYSVCEYVVGPTTTYEDVVAACPILQE